jgi:rhodanese-related sulfurtransferase
MKRRFALLFAASACAACVVWPAGGGPDAQPLTLDEALALGDKAVLVDVRDPWQYAVSHIPGAINVPGEQVEARADELRRLGRLPVFYCG